MAVAEFGAQLRPRYKYRVTQQEYDVDFDFKVKLYLNIHVLPFLALASKDQQFAKLMAYCAPRLACSKCWIDSSAMFDWWRRTRTDGRKDTAGDGRPKREQLRNAVFDRFDRHLLDRYHARHHVLVLS